MQLFDCIQMKLHVLMFIEKKLIIFSASSGKNYPQQMIFGEYKKSTLFTSFLVHISFVALQKVILPLS